MTDTSPRTRIGNVVTTPRPLSSYRDMFQLTDGELLAGPILDCPGGAAPFAAQVRRLGGQVVSVDPAYHLPRDEFDRKLGADLDVVASWTATNPENFDWDYLGSPTSYARFYELAAELFLADYSPDGERYIAAQLPELPFDDGAFRLTLSSHLLFCYPEHLDYDQHVASIRELMRVTTGEVRLFPLVDSAGAEYPRMTELRADLADDGIGTEIHRVRASFVAGGERMMSCSRRAS